MENDNAGELVLNGIQERIKELLAAGVSQTQVASAVGVTEGYISQLMQDEGFRDAVLLARGAIAAQDVEDDKSVDTIERAAREKIAGLLKFETNIMKVLKVYQTMNAAKRKTEEAAPLQANAGIVVNIMLPQRAIVDFKLTPDKQVIEVAGRSMATLPSNVLQAKLRDKQAAQLLTDGTQPVAVDLIKKLKQF